MASMATVWSAHSLEWDSALRLAVRAWEGSLIEQGWARLPGPAHLQLSDCDDCGIPGLVRVVVSGPVEPAYRSAGG
jgi:hypothetical protein